MLQNKIPKKIHYLWFGLNKKPENFLNYLETWKKYCPDYEIIEWNESNFDINICSYVKNAYNNKKWAFVADYARFYILSKEGGIYLDTDIELCKNLNVLLSNDCFIGFQDYKDVNGAIIGAIKNHKFINEILYFYNNYKSSKYLVLPYLMTKLLTKHGLKRNNIEQDIFGVHIYKNYFFYPFAYYEKFSIDMKKNDTYAIHWYDANWLPKWISLYIFPIIGLWKKIF